MSTNTKPRRSSSHSSSSFLPKSSRPLSRSKSSNATQRSSSHSSFSPNSSGPPPRSGSSQTTLIYEKRLTYDDVLTGKLTIPTEYAGVLLPKRRGGKQDRIMVPFVDNKGEHWEMEATYQGLSLNWDKFVKEHGLKHNDVIFFYNDDPSSEYYNIRYKKNGDAFVNEMHSESK